MEGHTNSGEFTYANHILPPRHLRLLRICRELSAENQLQCDFAVLPLGQPFTALSYTWGPATHDKVVILDGRSFRVRRNLWDFLRTARGNISDWLWIDAVCIDQTNVAERNYHVTIMDKIYRGASRTIVWLGEAEISQIGSMILPQDLDAQICLRDLDTVIEHDLARNDLSLLTPEGNGSRFMEQHPNKNEKSSNSEHTSNPKRLWQLSSKATTSLLFEHIFHHPYWKRVWIIQECILSSNKSLWYTKYSMSWQVLGKAIQQMFFQADFGLRPIRDRQVHNDVQLYLLTGPLATVIIPAFEAVGNPTGKCPYAASLGTSCMCPRACTRFQLGVAKSFTKVRKPEQSAEKLASIKQGIQKASGPQRDMGIHDSEIFHLLTTAFEKDTEASTSDQTEVLFMNIVRRYRRSQCAVRSDKIYGVLALAKQPKNLHVDYNMSVYDLFFSACLEISQGRLDVEHAADDINSRLMTRKKTLAAVAMDLLKTLGLEPLNLIFGDSHKRSILMAAPDQKKRKTKSKPFFLDQLPQFARELHRLPDRVTHVSLKGNCPDCGSAVSFNTSFDFSSELVVLQCHNKNLWSPTIDHVLLYTDELGNPIPRTAIHMSSRPEHGHSRPQGMNTTASAENNSTGNSMDVSVTTLANMNSPSLPTLAALLHLHEVFSNRPPLAYDGLPASIEPDKDLKEFYEYLAGNGTRGGIFSRRKLDDYTLVRSTIKKLSLEEVAEHNLIAHLRRHGMRVAES